MFTPASPHQSPNKRARDDRLAFLRHLPLPQRNAAINACAALTDQQLDVVKQARVPRDVKALGGRVSLVLAAAAAGKTTTLRAIIETLDAYGHG